MIMRLLMVLMFLTGFARLSPAEELFNASRKQSQALVVKVTNSDTLVLENSQRIKLIGVESIGMPAKKYLERDEKGNVIEVEEDAFIPLEDQAIVYAQDLLEGKKVRVEYDVNFKDAQGYTQAYVFLPDGRMANAQLLRMGFVHLRLSPPNLKYAPQLREAYQEAKKEMRGVQGE